MATKKCIQHISHCEKCKIGLIDYEERDENTYRNSELRYQQQEFEYYKIKDIYVLDNDDDPEKEKVTKEDIEEKLEENVDEKVEENGDEKVKEDVKSKNQRLFKENKICQKCSEMEREEDIEINTSTCEYEIELSQEFKELERQVCYSSTHIEHCSVCGIGLENADDIHPVNCIYDWYEIQDVMYPEVDHFRCDECYLASFQKPLKKLPIMSDDWYRKQSYIDFLLERRKQADTTSCLKQEDQQKSKRIKVN